MSDQSPSTSSTAPVSRAEYEALLQRLDRLQSKQEAAETGIVAVLKAFPHGTRPNRPGAYNEFGEFVHEVGQYIDGIWEKASGSSPAGDSPASGADTSPAPSTTSEPKPTESAPLVPGTAHETTAQPVATPGATAVPDVVSGETLDALVEREVERRMAEIRNAQTEQGPTQQTPEANPNATSTPPPSGAGVH